MEYLSQKEFYIPEDIQIKMGSIILYLIKETVKIKNEFGKYVPLIKIGYVRGKNPLKFVKFAGVLRIEENFIIYLLKNLEKTNSLFIQLNRSLPMIYKPAPWLDHEIGSYFQKPTNLMRTKGNEFQENAIKFSDLKNIYGILDYLGSTPWKINKNVLNIVKKIWETGGGKGEIPKRFFLIIYSKIFFFFLKIYCLKNHFLKS